MDLADGDVPWKIGNDRRDAAADRLSAYVQVKGSKPRNRFD